MATEEEPREDRSVVENGHASDGRAWDYLLQTWRELDVPEGWRAEIDERQIVLVPPPHARHNGIAAKIQRRLYATLPEDLEIYQTLGIHIALLGKLYVPDLVVMPAELIAAAAPEISDPMDASEALLVVEITSRGNAREDRTKKYRAYARAGVPMYLLIDRFDTRGPMATLFTEPNGDGTYKHTVAVAFGKSLTLPFPFDVELPTGEFPGAT